MKYVFIFILVLCIVKLNKCLPRNSTVLSKYAKVAMWGRNKTNAPDIEEGRNNKYGPIWNHRLDPKSISPHTKKKSPGVVYQYPVYQGPDSKLGQKTEHVPGIGEVIVAQAQDRFEARPLFAYKNKLAATYGPPSAPKPTSQLTPSPIRPPVAPAPPPAPSISAPPVPSFDSPPAPLSSLSAPNSGGDLYNSPFSSYNPPDFKPDDSGDDIFYPPNVPSSEDSNDIKSAVQASLIESQSAVQVSSTGAPKANTPDSYASLGPPLASYDVGEHSNYDNNPVNYEDQGQSQDPMEMYKNHEGPPDFPPKSEDDVYYPPDFPKDQVSYHEIPDDHGNMMKQPQDSMMAPPQDAMVQQDMMMDNGKLNGNEDDADLAPPPAHDYEHGHSFPQYLYDQHHYDHHIYEEIPHTTMAPVKEDKRVSSTHYSYYYLGRKLWYIPLYFSVYFIIYVTVLILKSIARHKVRLKYKWYEHDTSAKEHGRSMDLDSVRNEIVSHLHQNVSVALDNASKKYDSVLAMKK